MARSRRFIVYLKPLSQRFFKPQSIKVFFCTGGFVFLTAFHAFGLTVGNDSIQAQIDAFPKDSTILDTLFVLSDKISDDLIRIIYAEAGIKYSELYEKEDQKYLFLIEYGQAQDRLGNHSQALETYLEVGRYYRGTQDYDGEALAYNSIGNIYLLQDNLILAQEYYLKSIQVRINQLDGTIFNNRSLASDFNNLGEVYRLRKEFDSALIWFDSSMVGYRHFEDLLGLGYALGNLGLVYAERGEFELAHSYIDSATAYLEPMGDFYPIAIYHTYTADIYEQLEMPEEAERYLQESLEIATRLGLKREIRDAAKGLSDFYRRQELLKQALEYQDLYYIYKDSLYNAEVLKQNAEARADFEIGIREEKIERQRKVEWILGTLATLLLAIVAILMALRYRGQRERANFQNELLHSELKALRAQINPHFIFNALASIQQYVLKHDRLEANSYLTKFSRFIRLVLYNSDKLVLGLEDELQALTQYLDIEQLRLGHKFHYKVEVEEDLALHTLEVPSMLLQTFAENSVWHGLSPKEGEGIIHIQVASMENGWYISLRDNGIGREAAKARNPRPNHQSKGMKLVEDKVKLFNLSRKDTVTYRVEDLYSEEGIAEGTQVVVEIVQNA
ncbi:MAG: histidine kinase [Bacteroidota bacterium]